VKKQIPIILSETKQDTISKNYNLDKICKTIKYDWAENRLNITAQIEQFYKNAGFDIFLDKGDQEHYLSAVYSITKMIKPSRVIQTGTFIGGTLISILAAFNNLNINGTIDTIDPEPVFYGDGIIQNPVKIARATISKNNLSHMVNFYRGYSVKAWDKGRLDLPDVPEGVLYNLSQKRFADFLIVDGDHTFEGTFWDLEIGSRALRKDGARLIFVHDYASIPNVKEAIRSWKRLHGNKLLFRVNKERNGFAIFQCLPQFFNS
jgi:hypothetical protein